MPWDRLLSSPVVVEYTQTRGQPDRQQCADAGECASSSSANFVCITYIQRLACQLPPASDAIKFNTKHIFYFIFCIDGRKTHVSYVNAVNGRSAVHVTKQDAIFVTEPCGQLNTGRLALNSRFWCSRPISFVFWTRYEPPVREMSYKIWCEGIIHACQLT